MVSINECVIARDARYLYLKASIDDMEYFDNVYIDYLEFTIHKVVNDKIDTVTIKLNPDGTLHTKPYMEDVKNVDLTLTPQDLGIMDFRTPIVLRLFIIAMKERKTKFIHVLYMQKKMPCCRWQNMADSL